MLLSRRLRRPMRLMRASADHPSIDQLVHVFELPLEFCLQGQRSYGFLLFFFYSPQYILFTLLTHEDQNQHSDSSCELQHPQIYLFQLGILFTLLPLCLSSFASSRASTQLNGSLELINHPNILTTVRITL